MVQKRVIEGAAYALLHDIGKPLVRLCWRTREGIEKLGKTLDSILDSLANNARESWELGPPDSADVSGFKKFAKYILSLIMEVSPEGRAKCYAHEHVIEPILGRLGFHPDSSVIDAASKADAHSAAERRDVDVPGHQIKHHLTPLLNPFKLAEYLGLTTHPMVHLKLVQQAPYLRLESRDDKCVVAPGSGCYSRIKSRLSKFFSSEDLKKLLGEIAWHPVRPLRWRNWSLDDHRAYDFNQALSKSRYLNVVASTLSGLYQLASAVAKNKIDPVGVVESALGVLRRSLLYVPSAVYRSETKVVVPELSLYAHSRAVAAITQAILHPSGGESYRILVVDLKGIQKYIYSQKTVSAALRALRGRSLVVELTQRSVARWILDRLGLTWASILTYEGGRVNIVIPCMPEAELEDLAREIEERVKDEFMGLLGATVAWTDCISVVDSGHSLYEFNVEDERSLAGQLHKLNERLQERRFKISEFTGKALDPYNLRTDPLLDMQVHSDNWVNASPGIYGTLSKIAGDEGAEAIISEGGASLDTLRSLVGGTVAVNLALIIEFYVRGKDEDSTVNAIKNLVWEASRLLGLELGEETDGRLAFNIIRVGSQGYRVKVGIITFPKLGAIYLLVSLDTDLSRTNADDFIRYSLAVSKAILEQLSGIPSRKIKSVERIVVTLVNLPEAFMNLIDDASKLARALKSGLSLDWIPLNTFYPVKTSEEEGYVIYRSLDETVPSGILAVASMDGDNMGNTMIFMAAGTSRFATASELLSNTFGFHAASYLSRARPNRVYVAYSGGDDAIMFGNLHDVIEWVIELADLYTSMLPGSTISASIATGDVKEPLFLLFRDAKESLEKAKSTPLLTISQSKFNKPIIWRGGIVNVYGAFEEAVIPAISDSGVAVIRLNGVPYSGPCSLKKAVSLAGSVLGDTKKRSWTRRMLLAVKPLMKYMPRHRMESETAAALIQYAYMNERSRDEAGKPLLSMVLSETLNNAISIDYPSGANLEYERTKLILAVKLASNPINLAVHLARTATSQYTP